MNAKSLELQITVAAGQAVQVVSSLAGDFEKLAQKAKSFSGSAESVKDTMDSMEKYSRRTAAGMKLFGESSEDARAYQHKLKESILDLVQGGLNPESAEIQNLVAEYRKLDEESGRLEQSEQGLFGVFEKLKSEIGNVAAVAAAVKWDGMVAGISSFALDTADQFQTVRSEFGTLLGDMQAGAALFDSVIKPFNDLTPFDLDTTAQASKILMAAKVPVSDLTNMLNRLGNVAQGNSQKMISFANAFSKASAKGKADMEVLNVYLDQGIPILDELAKKFGVTTAEIQKMASEGKISFKDFQDSIISITNEGGAYFGGLELASRSYASMWAGLHEAMNSLAASIGETFLPAASKVLEWLTNVVNIINQSPAWKAAIVGVITAVTVALNAQMIKSLVLLVAKLWAAFAAQMALNTALSVTNIAIAAATLAVGALAAGYIAYASKQQQATEATNEQALALYSADQAANQYLKTLETMNNTQLQAELVTRSNNRTQEIARQIRAVDLAKAHLDGMNPNEAGYAEALKKYEEASAYLDRLKNQAEKERQAIEAAMQKNTENAAIEETKQIAARRDALYSRTEEAQLEQLEKELSFAKSLLPQKDGSRIMYAERDENGNFKNDQGFSQKQTYAIIRYLEQQIDQIKNKGNKAAGTAEKKKEDTKLKLADIGTEWAKKFRSELEQIQDEQTDALDKLSGKALDAFGITFEANEDYLREKAALEMYYQQKISDYEAKCAEEEKQRILNRHQQALSAIEEEYRYKAEKERELLENQFSSGGITGYSMENAASYAQNYAMTKAAGTQAGQVALGITDPLTMIIGGIIDFASELENVQKILNPLSTVLEGLAMYSEELLNDMLSPIVDILTDIGKTLGQVLQPVVGMLATALRVLAGIVKIVSVPLNLLGNAFEWFYNKVIRNVGNAIIKCMNGVIAALNRIPMVNIEPLKLLPEAGKKASEAAEELAGSQSAAASKIRSMYQAQIGEIDELLRYQIQSLQKQYELGLISRSEYIDQKNAYKAAADSKILEINQEMEATLAQIEANTYAALDANQAAGVNESREEYARNSSFAQSYAQKWGEVIPVVGHVAGAVADVAVGAWNGVKTAVSGIAGGIKNLFHFDVGTDNIPYDMPALVHAGEGIIPRTFNEAIKSGNYSLVGKQSKVHDKAENRQQNQPAMLNVTVTVEGSVIKHKDLVEEIYNGLAELINSGAAPLPA